ncbi:hypothetical protein D9753_34735 [Streptomyces dangxiongensis]|uniref:Uncharacterized protein n=1 Tax=Streptomyces dangxiongensis TaxID=1442032 RepID=A0A3G2JQL6_9ACTN|nr:hypothetical protein D9753_34735 [Streptomyces dangxiongensis]
MVRNWGGSCDRDQEEGLKRHIHDHEFTQLSATLPEMATWSRMVAMWPEKANVTAFVVSGGRDGVTVRHGRRRRTSRGGGPARLLVVVVRLGRRGGRAAPRYLHRAGLQPATVVSAGPWMAVVRTTAAVRAAFGPLGVRGAPASARALSLLPADRRFDLE